MAESREVAADKPVERQNPEKLQCHRQKSSQDREKSAQIRRPNGNFSGFRDSIWGSPHPISLRNGGFWRSRHR